MPRLPHMPEDRPPIDVLDAMKTAVDQEIKHNQEDREGNPRGRSVLRAAYPIWLAWFDSIKHQRTRNVEN